MKYGPNTELVEEIIEFVKNGNILVSQANASKINIITNDFNKATFLAWEEFYGDEGYSWTDIRELRVSKVKGASYQIENIKQIKENFKNIRDIIDEKLEKCLNGPFEEIHDDIRADLYNCAFCRAIYGKTDVFFEEIFRIYKLGGWPCGWYGNYPQGKIIAYFPVE